MAARPPRVVLMVAAAFATLSAPSSASAASLRKQIETNGDFALVGNTLVHDCASTGTELPVVGTVGPCGSNAANDSGADVFWLATTSGSTGGAAWAGNLTPTTGTSARTAAVLALPANAIVKYARLYWAALNSSNAYDVDAVLWTPDGATTTVVAEAGVVLNRAPSYWYQASAEITSIVSSQGPGRYQVSGVTSRTLWGISHENTYGAWWIVVFYQDPADTALRQLTLFDGLDYVQNGTPADVTLSGFLVPQGGYDAKLGVVAYEGDAPPVDGDVLEFEGYMSTSAAPTSLTVVTDALNPPDDFFNRTRSWLGVAQSIPGDLPRYSGTAGSMQGFDIDVVDLTSLAAIHAGDDTARIRASSTGDMYALGAFITSINTLKPSFMQTVKRATNLTQGDAGVFAGDVIEYVVSTVNTGNDPSIQSVMQDVLPVGVTFVPGSIRMVQGANAGDLSDAAGDDQGEYDAATRTVYVRLGTGANAFTGGTMAIGDTAVVRFRATVNSGASGTIQNRAAVVAAGQSGEPARTFDSNPPLGTGTTDLQVDQCQTDAHCGGATPACWTAATPNVCVGCTADLPYCGGSTPVCDLSAHACVPRVQVTPATQEKTTVAGVAAPFDLSVRSHLAVPEVFALQVTAPGCAWDPQGPASVDVPAGGATPVLVNLTPPPGTPSGESCVATVRATGWATSQSGEATVTLRVGAAATWTPDYAGTTTRIVPQGEDVAFAGVIQNNTSTDRAFALATTLVATNPTGQGTLRPVVYYSDPNGDGDPADGAVITQTAPIPAYGGRSSVVVVVHTDNTSGTPLQIGTNLTATSTATSGPATATQTALAQIHYAAPYADSGRTVVTRAFTPCDTVYLGASHLPTGFPFALAWYAHANPVYGVTTPSRIVDPWPVSGGVGTDQLVLPANASGTWTVLVIRKDVPGGTERDRITFEVERAGAIPSLVAPARVPTSGGLSVSATVRNDNASTTFHDTQISYTVTGFGEYLDGDGLFTTAVATAHLTAPVTVSMGGTTADAWVQAAPTWIGPGVYAVDASWRVQCGGATQEIAAANATVHVVPAAPVISTPAAGALVPTTTPTFSGTGLAGAAVTVTVDGGPTCASAVAGDGSWSCFLGSALGQGGHGAVAVQTVAGATSDDSATVGFTVDTAPPAVTIGAPTPGALLGGGVAPGGAVGFAGSAEAGATVTVAAGAATTTATLVGTSWTASLTLVDGVYVGTATATDAAGNAGTATVSFTVDLTPPAPPLLAAVPSPTNDDPIAVSGTAESSATVELFLDGVSQGTQVAGPAFAFSLGGVAADASHAVVATARDPAGNLSGPSAGRTFYVDRTAPGLADVAFPADGALLGGADAPGGVVVFTGTSEIASSVEVRVNGVVCDIVLAGAGGDWSASCAVLEGANGVDARATDAAGNVGAWSAATGFDLDATAPLAPVLDALATPAASGEVTVTGTVGDLTATVGVYVDGSFVGTATGAGGFSLDLSLGEGTFVITARAMDLAGNRSALSNAVPLTVDETPPAAPAIDPIVTPTNAATVTVAGTTDPGTVVTVYRSGVAVGAASESGGRFALEVGVGEGGWSFTARAADAAGNSSALSGARDVEVDRTAPGAPVLDPIVSPTNATSLTVAGTAEAGTTVTVRRDGSAVGAATVSGGRFALTLPLAEGTFSFTATAADAAGNVSPVSNTRTVEVDQAAPAAPSLDPLVTPTNAASVVVRGASDAGTTVTILRDGVAVATASVAGGRFAGTVAVFAGSVTFTATATDAAGNVSPVSNAVTVDVDHSAPAVPTLDPLVTPTNGASAVATGRADAGTLVTLLLGGAPAGVAVAAGDGTFSIPVGLSDGTNVLTATAADSAGNVSGASAPVTVVVDLLDPDAPILGALDSPTGASTVTVAGTAEAGSLVTLYRDGVDVGTVTAAPGGGFALDVGVAEGTFTFTGTAQDAAGNVSLPSLGVTVVVDHGLPAPPDLAALASPTNATTVTVSGTAEAGASVTVSLGGAPVGTVVASGGTFSLEVGVPEGELSFTAVARDLAGNLSAQSNTVFVTVDRTAPALPGVVAPANGALLGAAAAPGGAVIFDGTSDPSTSVVLEIDLVTTTISAASGAWATSLALADGPHTVRARASDAVGNTSAWSAPTAFSLDTAAPGAPVLDPLVTPTNAASITVTGTAEPGATVTVLRDGASVGTATATGGTFSLVVPTAEGAFSFTAVASDAAGNASPVSGAVPVAVDRTAPLPPVLDPVPTPTGADPIVITCSAEAGATVTIYLDGAPWGSGTVCDFPLAGVSSGAIHWVHVVARDPAGNLSGGSAVSFFVDREPPGLAVVLAPADGAVLDATEAPAGVVSFSGTAEPSSTVEVQVDGDVHVVSAAGGSWFLVLPLAEGGHTVRARVTDAALNVGDWSGSSGFVVDSVAPLAPVLDVLVSPTSAAVVTVTGTVAEVGATAGVYVDGAFAGTATGWGGFSLDLSLAEGSYTLTARALDTAGNRSAVSNAVSLTVDRTAPAAPVLDPIVTPTNAASVTVAGTTDPGTVVTIYRSGVAVGAASESGGRFALGVAVAEGSWSFTARAADAAGNSSALSGARDVEVDRTAPGAPVLDPLVSPTNASSLTVAGTAEAGATVTVRRDGSPVGAATVSGGRFALTLPLAVGTFSFTATATDAAGNVSPVSNTRTVEVDQTAPAAPSLDPLVTPTNAASVVVRGASGAGTTVTIRRDGVAVATASVVGGRFAGTVAVFAGAVTFTATATDAAGNVSPVSNAVTVDVDHSVPAVPALDPLVTPTNAVGATVSGHADAGSTVTVLLGGVPAGVAVAGLDGTFSVPVGLSDGANVLTATATDGAGNVSGESAPPLSVLVDRLAPDAPILAALDSPTGASTVSVTGSAEAGSLVTVYRDGVDVGTVTATPGGGFALDVGVADGTFGFTATARDAAGNGSISSAEVTLVVDHTLPTPPVLAALASPTNAATVVVTGTAEVGSVVTVLMDGAPVGTTATGVGGAFSLPVTVPEGVRAFTATSRDAVGHASASSNTVLVTVDRTAPSVPDVVTPAPGVLGAAAAPDGLVAFAGTTDAGTTVELDVDGAASTLAGASGSWSANRVLADGGHQIRARARDDAGNASAWSPAFVVTVDRIPPPPPSLDPIVPATTSAASVTVSGSAEAGTVVTLQEAGWSGTVTAGSDGRFSVVVPVAEGWHGFVAYATDAAGNGSPYSNGVTVTVDRTPPGLATVDAPADGAVLGAGAAPGGQVTLSGTAEAGSTVEVEIDGAVIDVVAAPGGRWAASRTLLDGAHQVRVRATDAAGNAGAWSTASSIAIDTSAPPVPVLDALASPTSAVTVTATGTVADLGVTVGIYVDGVFAGTATGSGGFSLDLTLAEGTSAIRARALDLAGNVSAFSDPVAVTVDRTAPPAPTVDPIVTPTSASTVPVGGHAEGGATVSVLVDGVVVATTVAAADGSWTVTVPVADGGHAVTAIATDPAGNGSGASVGVPVSVDTHVPAAPVFTRPVAGATLPAGVVILEGTAEAGATVAVQVDGRTYAATASGDGRFSVTTAPLPAGTWTATAIATDGASNTSAVATVTFATIAGGGGDSGDAGDGGGHIVGGGCGCGVGGGSHVGALLLVALTLAFAPRRRVRVAGR